MEHTREEAEQNSTGTSKTEGDDTSAQEIEKSDYQSDEFEDNVYIWDDKISLGELHHSQSVNQNTVEDLCIPEIKHDVNLGCFEAYSIFDSEDITKHLGSSIRNNFDHVTRLDKLKEILELDQFNIEERK